MKKIIALLFTALLLASCGSSDGGGSGDKNNNAGTVKIPGSSSEKSTANTATSTKPTTVVSGCKSGILVPGCS